MRNYDDLREMLCNELSDLYNETMKKGGASASDLDAIRDITSAIKNTYKIEMFEDEEYSHGGDWDANIRGNYGHGSSYRGRHRDAMGRYSRTDARDNMRMKLEDMMRNADNDTARDAIRRCIDALER